MLTVWLVMLVVIAGLFFALWLVAHHRADKSRIILVEPLFLLIKAWQIARYTGAGAAQVETTLRVFGATKTGESDAEKILPLVKGKLPKVALLDSRLLSLIGEQKLVAADSKRISIIIGLPSEVSSQLILTAAEKQALDQLSNQAGENGFLTLVVGRTAVHGEGERLKSLQHVYLGAVLLEPTLDQKVIKLLANITDKKQLLTVLPAAFTGWLVEQAGLAGSIFNSELTESAEKFEQKVQSAMAITSADQDTRFRVVRSIQLHHRCSFWTKRELDQRLPVSIQERPTTN